MRRLAAWALGALLSGCGTALTPVPAEAPEQPASSSNPSVQVFNALGPAATHYTSEPTQGAVLGDEPSQRLAQLLVAAGAKHGHTLEGDGRLAQLAQWAAQATDEHGRTVPAPVVDFWARHLGLVEPVPMLMVLSEASEPSAEQAFDQAFGSGPNNIPFHRYGIGTAQRFGQRMTVAAVSSVPGTLKPVAREATVGSNVQLDGKLLDGYRDLELVVTGPDGTVQRSQARGTASFSVPVKLKGAGAHRIELLAKGPSGLTVVFNFPVYAGVKPPLRMSVALGGETPVSAEQASSRLLVLVNQSRAEAGLPRLQPHGGLAALALSHSQDMAEHGFFGHVSPTQGPLEQRAERAGYVFSVLAENVGRGPSAEEVHQMLLESPGHRGNMLHPKVTHVGIGVVLQDRPGGRDLIATQLFAQLAAKLDLQHAPLELLRLINQQRKVQGLRELSLEPALSEIAAKGARRFFETASATGEQVLDSAASELGQRMQMNEALNAKLGAAQGCFTTGSDLKSAARCDAALAPNASVLGVGVAQGQRQGMPSNSIVVVMLVGWRR